MKYTDNRQVFKWNVGECGIPYLSSNMLDELGYPNLYTTRYRNWDASKGTGAQGLRVAYMKGEDVAEARSVISKNLGALAENMGSDLDHLVVTHQLHTANVKMIGADDLGYWKSVEIEDGIDGLITDVPGACLVVYGADCPSIYIVDPVKHAIGLVHAGWKGTFGKIPEAAIAMMQSAYGCNPADMYAAIGPSICEDCYEMGDEIYDMLAEQWGKEDADLLMKRHPALSGKQDTSDKNEAHQDSGKYHLDLWQANRLTLERAGIPTDHIEVTNLCTCCNADEFYSYRAHKMENEQAAMLVNGDGVNCR